MPLTLFDYLQNHPYGRLDPTGFPDPGLAYYMNQGENVLAVITITDGGGNPIPASDILNVLISLRRDEVISLSWSWIKDGVQSPQITVADGLITLEIEKQDTEQLASLYDFEVQATAANADFFDSGGQTTVMEVQSTLFVRATPFTPVST